MRREELFLIALLVGALTTCLYLVVAMAQSPDCEVVYNQSGTYICLPIASNISTSVGSILVLPLDEKTINITIVVYGYTNEFECSIDIYVENTSGYTLFHYQTETSEPMIKNITVNLPEAMDFVVVHGEICNVTILPFAVRMPKKLIVPIGDNPIVVFLATVLPVAPIIGFLLRSSAAEGAIATIASLPFVYILAMYISPTPSRVPVAIGISFIVGLIIAAAFRRSGGG